jgi:heme A synthase
VPDWPTSYGWNMFAFPPSMWVANIVYEHGHRLIASRVAALTIVLVCCLWIARVPRWLRWFGVIALSIVIAQGFLGGLTVLLFPPPAISTAHAALAELFLCATMSIASGAAVHHSVEHAGSRRIDFGQRPPMVSSTSGPNQSSAPALRCPRSKWPLASTRGCQESENDVQPRAA